MKNSIKKLGSHEKMEKYIPQIPGKQEKPPIFQTASGLPLTDQKNSYFAKEYNSLLVQIDV